MDALEAVSNATQQGAVLLNDSTVRSWLRSARRSDTIKALDLDPDGINVAFRMILHNDTEWRCQVLCKVNGTDEPTILIVDVSMEDWTRAEAGTATAVAKLTHPANSR